MTSNESASSELRICGGFLPRRRETGSVSHIREELPLHHLPTSDCHPDRGHGPDIGGLGCEVPMTCHSGPPIFFLPPRAWGQTSIPQHHSHDTLIESRLRSSLPLLPTRIVIRGANPAEGRTSLLPIALTHSDTIYQPKLPGRSALSPVPRPRLPFADRWSQQPPLSRGPLCLILHCTARLSSRIRIHISS